MISICQLSQAACRLIQARSRGARVTRENKAWGTGYIKYVFNSSGRSWKSSVGPQVWLQKIIILTFSPNLDPRIKRGFFFNGYLFSMVRFKTKLMVIFFYAVIIIFYLRYE